MYWRGLFLSRVKDSVVLRDKVLVDDFLSSSASEHCVIPWDSPLYGELEAEAFKAGVKVETYAYRRIRRLMEKVAGGMSIEESCSRSNVRFEDFVTIVQSNPGLCDILESIQHDFDMKVLGSLSRSLGQEKGNARAAMDVLERQTRSFAPAKQSVSVERINVGEGQILDASEID